MALMTHVSIYGSATDLRDAVVGDCAGLRSPGAHPAGDQLWRSGCHFLIWDNINLVTLPWRAIRLRTKSGIILLWNDTVLSELH